MPRFYRSAQPLPDPSTLPFPGNIIRLCSDCDLRGNCTAPVPGEHIEPSLVMFVGEAPGQDEDEWGFRPFVGRAGQQFDSLLAQSGIPRGTVAISNTAHCRPHAGRKNIPPTPAQSRACRKWLELELSIVKPSIVVAMGAPAIRWFLGDGAGTVEHLHGHPVEKDGRVILPVYHPAAALRNTSLLRHIADDFQVLRQLVKGRTAGELRATDEHPDPVYRVADTAALHRQMEREISEVGHYGVDTELWKQNTRLWAAQFSTAPGTGWFLPVPEHFKARLNLATYPSVAVVHNYLFDVDWLGIRDDGFQDTMIMAYLCGQPQGLKELAYRLCGIHMINYSEMVRPGQRKLSVDYLTEAARREWPDPVGIEETKWDNKQGKIVTKLKRPWRISRKISGILADTVDSLDTDPYQRWRDIDEQERQVVEAVLGPMPESSLADIPFEDAVQYATRDADATLRVYLKLRKMITDAGLDFILSMDTAVLPMVHTMMKNGMAVDLEYFRGLSAEFQTRMEETAERVGSLVGHPCNPNSSAQVATVVYDELGFTPTKKTPTGLVSTDDQELKKVNHPVIRPIIQYRGLLKLKTTYADNIIRSSHPDETGVARFHTRLNVTRTGTGRLSSSKDSSGEGGNLQNIPTRTADGKRIRNGFVAPDGKLLLEGDYGQIEVVSVAHLSRCAGLIDIFNRGDDPHTITASKIFGVPYEEAKLDKYRYPTKRANFGVIYLIGPKGLADQIQEYISDLEMAGEPVDVEPWTEQQCQEFITDWYKLYPEVRDYQHIQIAHARRYGWVADMFGRRRFIPEVSSPIKDIAESGERMAANLGVQATAQGIIKLAMGKLWRELPGTEWRDDVRWLMQIHDSLIVEATDDDGLVRDYVRWMRGVMTGVVKLVVPIKVDFKVGKSWGELKKLV